MANQRILSPRAAAFDVLFPFEKKGRAGDHRLKADVLLDGVLTGPGKDWDDRDRRFFTQLVYGVLRQWFVLNAMLMQHKPLKALEPKVRTMLRLGLYQKYWLDSVPDYAALDTTLELAQQKRFSVAAKGLLTGVLNAVTTVPDKTLPSWWENRMLEQYNPDERDAMIRWMQIPAPLSLRVNTLKTAVGDFHQALAMMDLAFVVPDAAMPEVLVLTEFAGSPRNLPGYEDGWFTVQDPSSALVAYWLDPQPTDAILDCCAAPGSKTTHLAARMQNQGRIIALEPVEVRVARLHENLSRLGVSNTQVIPSTAEQFDPANSALEQLRFDKILVDAPCSGTGTLRKHPEILIQLVASHLEDYTRRQLEILKAAARWLKPGGILLYSTCSLERSENRGVIDAFLTAHSEFTLIQDEQRLIREFSDGFYLAKLRKTL